MILHDVSEAIMAYILTWNQFVLEPWITPSIFEATSDDVVDGMLFSWKWKRLAF